MKAVEGVEEVEEEECTTRFPNPVFPNPANSISQSAKCFLSDDKGVRKRNKRVWRKGREQTANSHSSSLSLNNASIRSFFAVFFSEPGAVRIFNLLTICLPSQMNVRRGSERIDKGGKGRKLTDRFEL